MKIYFRTRTAMRDFKGNGEKRDLGKNTNHPYRWAVDFTKRYNSDRQLDLV